MDYRKLLFKRSVLVFLFTSLAAILSYFFRFFLARKLSIADFGLFYAILSFFVFILIFVDLGIGQSLVKHLVELRMKKPVKSGKGNSSVDLKIKEMLVSNFIFEFSLAFLFFVLVYFFSSELSQSFFHVSAVPELRLIGVWFLTLPLFYFFSWLYLGYQRSTWYALLDFLKIAALFGIAFLLFTSGFGRVSPFIAYALLNVVLLVVCFWTIPLVIPSFWKLPFTFSFSSVFSVLRLGVYIGLSGFAWLVLTTTDTLMLTYFRTLEEVALYQAALPIASILSFFSTSLIIVLFPLSTELWVSKQLGELRQLLPSLYRYLFMIVLPIALLFVVYPEEILAFLFGVRYVGASVVLRIFALGSLLSVFAMTTMMILLGIGNPRRVALLSLSACVLNVVLNFILIPPYGIIGASVATVASYALLFFLTFRSLRSSVSFSVPLSSFLLTFFAGILFAAVLFTLKAYLPLQGIVLVLCSSVVAGLCYLIALFAFRVLDFKVIKGFLFKRK